MCGKRSGSQSTQAGLVSTMLSGLGKTETSKKENYIEESLTFSLLSLTTA